MNSQLKKKDEGGFSERLKIALNQRSGRSVAIEAGLSPSVFSQYATGKNLPTLRHLTALSDALGVDVGWLATGRGSMRYDSERTPKSEDPTHRLMVLDAPTLTTAIKHLEQIERETGAQFDAEGRAATIAGLYLALMRDRASGKSDSE